MRCIGASPTWNKKAALLADLLFVEQGTGQLEVLTFARARIELFRAVRSDTFDVGGIVHRKPGPLVQCARVPEHMSAARFIDVKANHLLAHGTLCRKRMKLPSSQEFYELYHPYG